MLDDILSNLSLSPEQKQALQNIELELAAARTRMKQLEGRLASLEEQAEAERSLLTRPEFNREVARMLAFDDRYGGTSSMLYFDIASLSGLATLHGQALESEVSRTIAQVLTRSVRRSDIVGRLAADEFGVFLVRCNNEDAWKKGRQLAAALMLALEVIDGKKLGLDIRFGAYTFHEDENVAIGLKEAALALTKVDRV